ncbi:DNA- helicase [Aspergillus sclerotialis]|uniref:ATP-dependent DNA helicase n=1 Tax=Aspergillus sclerotialis TaxID=2070753 RepID=A0A3A3AAT7_9EURO|nr:DNA- helicase [Aspergillus sclerotialis]
MDQVTALQSIGVPVATINSNTTIAERRLIMEDLLSGHPRTRLLYVTPELCLTESFRRNLQTIHSQGELIRVAIDEAHCISEWGHDFRPAYKELSWFKRTLKDPAIPISAFTATATPRVRSDIISLLGLDTAQLKIFNTPSARPNIHYEVRYLADFTDDSTTPAELQFNNFVSWLKSIRTRREARLGSSTGESLPPISGIIYVSLRSISEKLANALTASGNNIHAVAYHAGLSNEERSRIQAMWTSPEPYKDTTPSSNNTPPSFTLIVATNAFGMGIDNPNVRFVVHWSPPRSFEGFVQESGRAGRDGRAAASIVYYSSSERDRVFERLRRDAANSRSHPGTEIGTGQRLHLDTPDSRNQPARVASFIKVINYCETSTQCRHDLIRKLFGDKDLEKMGSFSSSQVASEKSDLCDFACDFCKEGPEALKKRMQVIHYRPESPMDPYDY